MSFKSSVITSLLWKFLERVGTQGVQFIVAIVLARLLSPADFGLIALVTVFVAIANVFVQSGLNTALIQKKDADNLDFSTVFYSCLTLACLLYILLFFGAPLIASFYNDLPELIPVIRVLGLMLPLGALNAVQEAYISRNMMFRKLFYRSVGAIIPSGCIGIICAYSGWGIWSLVVQQLSNSLFVCVIMWFTVKWRPSLSFSIERWRKLFSFGWKLLCSALLDTAYRNVRDLVIGKLFSPADLGYYNRGDQFPKLIIMNVNASIQSVLLPSFSTVQDDLVRLKSLARRSIKIGSFLILPMMAGLAAVA
jgi:O-antigen/teichoic acid export membrane protein